MANHYSEEEETELLEGDLTIQRSVRFSEKFLEVIEQEARREGRTFPGFVRFALLMYIKDKHHRKQ